MPSGHEAGRVLGIKGITPTIKENHGTVYAVKLDQNIDTYDEYNHTYHKNSETIGTIQSGYTKVNHGHRVVIKKINEK